MSKLFKSDIWYSQRSLSLEGSFGTSNSSTTALLKIHSEKCETVDEASCIYLCQASPDSAFPGLVGGVQRINVSYPALQGYPFVPTSNMSLEMRLLPESSWESMGSPPPSTVNFISPTPLAQDVLLGLKYNDRRASLTFHFT